VELIITDFPFDRSSRFDKCSIRQALLDVQPKIVHFSGHGTANGELYFENATGSSHPVQPDALAALFEQFANQAECVVENLCPQRDSNPCFGLERAASWAARRWGPGGQNSTTSIPGRQFFAARYASRVRPCYNFFRIRFTGNLHHGEKCMFDPEKLEQLRREYERWEETSLQRALSALPERQPEFTTISSEPIQRLYTPLDIADLDYMRDLGLPGEYPYTRGVHPTMHRGRLWTMRMFAGFGAAEETNARFRYLLDQGQTGLSIAFDLPTLMGYDTDAPEALGEFGKCGVAVSSLEDMLVLLQDIPLDKVSTSMTINSPAAIIWAMYIAAAEKQGVRPDQLRGTLQNDILKEYIAQKEYIFPPEPSMRLVVDTIEYGTRYVQQWNTVSVSGYHIREAGSTASQELAFTLADGMEYVRWSLKRGLEVDSFAPRLSFFFNAHNDFFEEIAKYRAARRIWAHQMRHVFGARNPRAWLMRFHTQTAGVSLTAQQPENNIVRVAVQALAAVLGGTQSLHTNSMDEALALPSEHAVTIALRTQQILAEESGVANTIDPLAGSYFIEAQTNRIQAQAEAYFRRIDEIGGVLPAIDKGFFQSEISDAAYLYQREIDESQRRIVGVNAYAEEKPLAIPLLEMDPQSYQRQVRRLEALRQKRDLGPWGQSLDRLRLACQGTQNTMPFILDAVRANATLGEIVGVMRDVFGVYQERAGFNAKLDLMQSWIYYRAGLRFATTG
jgi:methylmalonyl-CoA mutase, N-terminal domain